jgi:hypothetical protein
MSIGPDLEEEVQRMGVSFPDKTKKQAAEPESFLNRFPVMFMVMKSLGLTLAANFRTMSKFTF